MQVVPTMADMAWLAPELTLTVGLLILLIGGLFVPRDRQSAIVWAGFVVLGATLAALVPQAGRDVTIANGVFAVDGFAVFIKVIAIVAAMITLETSRHWLTIEGVRATEYVVLVMTATLGMMVMASGVDLVTMFIGLETMAVSFYVMVGYLKPNRRSNEAALKYFVLGTFSTGVLIYGMAWTYGLAGSTRIADIAIAAASPEGSIVAWRFAIMLLIAGLGFKIAAVPFHMWAPDVYEGAPTPIASFLSVGSKAASFAMLIRLMLEAFPSASSDWRSALYVLAALSMTVGNIAAMTQNNLKRLLAYSSIAHAGYVTIGLVAATPRGISASLVYIAVYACMQMGAFAIVTALRQKGVPGEDLHEFSGLAHRRPWMAFAMLIFMIALGGIPPTAGFMGKMWLFGAAIDSGYVWLAVIGVANSVLSLYYYARVVMWMWMTPQESEAPLPIAPSMAIAISLAAAAVIIGGLFPDQLFTWAESSARALGVVSVAPALTLR